jgi:hypothetical protein
MHRFLVAFNGDKCSSSLSMDGFFYNSIIDDDSIANTKANNVIKLSEISKNCMKKFQPTILAQQSRGLL